MRTRDITAIVLCGGSGTRLGTEDKTLLPVQGRPLVSYTAAALEPQIGRLILGCGRDTGSYRPLGYETVADVHQGEGPLGGVVSTLAAVDSPWILIHPGDTPFPDHALVARLGPLADARGLAVPRTGHQRQHLVLLMSRAVADQLAAFYESGGRAVREWLDELGAQSVDLSDIAESFFNVNTPDDLAEAERRIAAARREGSGS
jgi:molybdopterin-guanine dinucleotide biosynthesis protein A